jgi:glutamyl-tRNA reductase
MLPPASIGSVAAELARRHLAAGTRDGQLALIGAGHVARAVLHELHRTRVSVGRVTILNRSVERARLLAASTQMNVQSLAALPAVLRQAAVVIAATSAPAPIITSADLSTVAAERPSLLIDAGAPRNVDATVAELPGLTLVTVDSLGERAEELRRAREELVPRVEELVGEAVYGSSVPA